MIRDALSEYLHGYIIKLCRRSFAVVRIKLMNVFSIHINVDQVDKRPVSASRIGEAMAQTTFYVISTINIELLLRGRNTRAEMIM